MASKKRGLGNSDWMDKASRAAGRAKPDPMKYAGKPKSARTRTSRSTGKPLQISPVGSSETQGWSRNKPKNIPQGYGLQMAMTSPPKYRLVKAKPLDMKKGVKRAASQMGAKPKMMGRRRGK